MAEMTYAEFLEAVDHGGVFNADLTYRAALYDFIRLCHQDNLNPTEVVGYLYDPCTTLQLIVPYAIKLSIRCYVCVDHPHMTDSDLDAIYREIDEIMEGIKENG